MNKLIQLEIESDNNYALLDSGEGEKLESFAGVVLSRPDPQALWQKRLPKEEWKKAAGVYVREEKGGRWEFKNDTKKKWDIKYGGFEFSLRPTAFKHVGLFPEQGKNWSWMEKLIRDRVPHGSCEVLNLFGYTGGATLAAAKAGAKVVHVDGSKTAIAWARENAALSGLDKKPVRWILDDAHIFVKREVKRGRKYEGIVMDPPAFGHGPEGELWKIEENFLPLFEDCLKILSDKPVFFLVNGYSAGYSAMAYRNNLEKLLEKYGGQLEAGELFIKEETHKGLPARSLPCGIFARWSGQN